MNMNVSIKESRFSTVTNERVKKKHRVTVAKKMITKVFRQVQQYYDLLIDRLYYLPFLNHPLLLEMELLLNMLVTLVHHSNFYYIQEVQEVVEKIYFQLM